jgi:hypothetical protein
MMAPDGDGALIISRFHRQDMGVSSIIRVCRRDTQAETLAASKRKTSLKRRNTGKTSLSPQEKEPDWLSALFIIRLKIFRNEDWICRGHRTAVGLPRYISDYRLLERQLSPACLRLNCIGYQDRAGDYLR